MPLKQERKRNGTIIARIAYKEGVDKYRQVGELMYFSTNEAKLRLDVIPARAWHAGGLWFIGNYIESDKYDEAPLIEGDIKGLTDKRGGRIDIGHIHTRQSPDGLKTQYFMELFGIPVGMWRKIIESDNETGRSAMYLPIELEG